MKTVSAVIEGLVALVILWIAYYYMVPEIGHLTRLDTSILRLGVAIIGVMVLFGLFKSNK